MVRIDVEKRLTDLLFQRGFVLTYTEKEASSPEDMYEITFYLDNGKDKSEYKTIFIRNSMYPKKKAFGILLDEIIDSYFDSINLGKKESVALSD